TYDFGFGEVEYKPSQAQEIVTLLNSLLYYAQKEQRIDESRLAEFLRSYESLIGMGAAKTAKQQAARNRQAAIEQKIEEHKSERVWWGKGIQGSIERYT